MSSQAQVKAIYSLLGERGLRDEKKSIVSAFTGDRTDSVRQMSFEEARDLISHLKTVDRQGEASTKMRNKILAMAHEMHWKKPSPSGVLIIDMDHVNNWCRTLGYLHKPLDDYTYNELPKLVSQFEAVYKSYLKGV